MSVYDTPLVRPSPFALVYNLVTKYSIFQLSKVSQELRQMCAIYCVDVDSVPVYARYFDITLIPATIFFFNGQHMKVDWG